MDDGKIMELNGNKLNISLIITIVTILISAGGSFAIVKAKTDKIDGIEAKVNAGEVRLVKAEAVIENISDSLKEQKEMQKETRDDMKLILKAVMEKKP